MTTDPREQRAQEFANQAEQQLQHGDLAMALASIRKALALRPRAREFHQLLGSIYQQAGKDVLAEKAFAAARALDADETAAVQPQITLDITAEPDLDLSPGQHRLLLDGVMRCLAEIAATEDQLRDAGLSGSPAFRDFQEVREQLSQQAEIAREAWREDQRSVPPPAATTPARSARTPPPEYRAIPAFSHTLGTIHGAVTEGPEVLALQRLLALEGLPVPQSGRFDQSTMVAVGKLQERYGLRKRDGIVNVETRQLLNRLTGHTIGLRTKDSKAAMDEQTRASLNDAARRWGTGKLPPTEGPSPSPARN